MANKHMSKSSSSFVNKYMQMKTRMRLSSLPLARLKWQTEVREDTEQLEISFIAVRKKNGKTI